MDQILVTMFQSVGTAKAKERLANFSEEVTEGRISVRAEEECIERGGWIMNS